MDNDVGTGRPPSAAIEIHLPQANSFIVNCPLYIVNFYNVLTV